jgi:hypothetical protein
MPNKTFYQLLEVNQNADQEEIVAAYNELREKLIQELAESEYFSKFSKNLSESERR